MARIVNDVEAFRADRAWGALDLAEIDRVTVRLHWTDEPCKWHRNDGVEVFVVLDGTVDMHFREASNEKVVRLESRDMFIAFEGDEHVAHPVGETRILVIERKGSV
ncbi:MAG: cupin [Hyphomicrobiales bacterium]|nr:cupin [Hyphomicrobiales bacterium]